MGMAAKNRAARSPLQEPSLPQPGDSLQDQIWERKLDLLGMLGIPVCFFAIALFEWWRYLVNSPPSPVLMTLLFVGSVVWGGRRLWQARRELEKMALGARGERTVGQMLELLRAQGYRTFHIDHVLIGPAGVFCIETKTWSKPNGECEIVYDGQKLLMNGHVPERDPLTQSKANARRVREILKQMAGRDVRVKPVVLFPGWWVQSPLHRAEVYVANPKLFLQAFRRGREYSSITLRPGDISFLAAGMERYLRQK
jgi:hypothetical protein